MVARRFFEERGLGFFEAVERFRGMGVGRLVRMDQERLFAVLDLDVRVGHAGLEIEHGVGIEAEGGEDTFDLGVLYSFD